MMGKRRWLTVLVLAGCGGAYGSKDAPDSGGPPLVEAGTPEPEAGSDAATDASTDAVGDAADAASSVTVVKAVAGNDFVCAYRTDGVMGCWGGNGNGQLGDNSKAPHDVAKAVSGITSGVTGVAAGDIHACAIVNGGAKCWGYNGYGQLGTTAANTLVPNDVSNLASGVASIVAAAIHTCAITTGGGVKCWGANGGAGQLGNGNLNGDSPTPGDVLNLASGVTAIAVTSYSTCALQFGALLCWGGNNNGQLGNNTVMNTATPVANGLTMGVTSMNGGAATVNGNNGARHMCAMQDGGAKCWGQNDRGQLGNNLVAESHVPVPVQGLSSGVAAVAANGYHSCALTTSGGVKCWGANDKGQLGNPVVGESHVPVDVTGLTSGVKAITAGGFHTCAVTTAGKVKCWGLNDVGQLGTGVTGGQSNMPGDISGL